MAKSNVAVMFCGKLL